MVEDQKFLSAVPSWDYRNYARLCFGCLDTRQFLEMAVDGDMSNYDCQRRLRDRCVGAYARRWRALIKSCPGLLLNMLDLDVPFVRHATESKHGCRMRERLHTNISSGSELVDLS